jgi:hypothetical protein
MLHERRLPAARTRPERSAATVVILVALASWWIAGPAAAREMSPEQVTAAVTTWVRSVTADARPDAVIEKLEPHFVNGQTIGYVARLRAGGFCLCGADDLVLPVYLYSPQCSYDPAIPDYQFIFWEIEQRLTRLRTAIEQCDPELARYEPALQERAAFWRDLIAGRVSRRRDGNRGRGEPDLMTLPVASYWHQGSPYNDQTPVLTPGSDEHCAVGCVATAMAQIMYYWRWPNSGGPGQAWCALRDYRWRDIGDWDYEPLATNPQIPPGFAAGRLKWIPDNGGQLGMMGYWDDTMYSGSQKNFVDPDEDPDPDYLDALEALWDRLPNQGLDFLGIDFNTVTYDWSRIQDVHSDDPPGGDHAEVAKLCYHAGLATCMDYGIWSSSASSGDMPFALGACCLGYDSDVAWWLGASSDVITDEILWLRPVALGGCNADGGCHEWVACGYNKGTDPNRQLLMNLGGGAGSTQWLSLDQIYPIKQDMVTWIAPRDVVKFVGGSAGGDGSPRHPYENVAAAAQNHPDGATLIFKAGSVNTFAGGPVVFNRPCTLTGYSVVIQGQ